MLTKLKSFMTSAAMVLTFGFPQMIQSMEEEKGTPETTQLSQGQKIKILTSCEQDNVNRMVMFVKYQKEREQKELPQFPEEIHGAIFGTVHERPKKINPVLEGELIYTSL